MLARASHEITTTDRLAPPEAACAASGVPNSAPSARRVPWPPRDLDATGDTERANKAFNSFLFTIFKQQTASRGATGVLARHVLSVLAWQLVTSRPILTQCVDSTT